MNRNYKAKETMLVITVGFLIIYYFTGMKGFLIISIIIGIAGIMSFYLSEKIDCLWQKLSYYLGQISNSILLTLVFFMIVTPVGFIRRLAGKRSITDTRKAQASYFEDRSHTFSKKEMEKIW